MELYQERPELAIKDKKGEEKKEEPKNILAAKKWDSRNTLSKLQFILINCSNLNIMFYLNVYYLYS